MADNDPLILDFVNGRMIDGEEIVEFGPDDYDDEPADWDSADWDSPDWDSVDLGDAFDLPPVLPPVRLPAAAELASQARRSALIADLRTLADEVRGTPVQAAAVNPALLLLAENAELVHRDGEALAPGEDAGWLDDPVDDEHVLTAWEYTFGEVLDLTLEVADDPDPGTDDTLDLAGHGHALALRLFLSWREGARITELADDLKHDATAGLAEEEAGRPWQQWVDAHGDPLRLLLDQLERLGAVSVTGDVVRLEPLGVHAVRAKLERDDLLVPVLPAPEEMTPDDLMLVWVHGSADDVEAELAAWTASRGQEQAARELLAFAADGDAMTRTSAVTMVFDLGPAAEPAWREALDRFELRGYAKQQLARLAGLDPVDADLPAELRPELIDVAWLIADSFGPVNQLDLSQETLTVDVAKLRRVCGAEKPDEVFEAMARLDHPDAGAVLTMIASSSTTRRPPKPPGGPRTRPPPAKPPAGSAAPRTGCWRSAGQRW